MLQERQRLILNAAVQEYIRTARPVASRELVEEFEWELSPATVRSELLELDGLGYLEQPHTSAGRTPTDKGYRFFADNAGSEAVLSHDEELLIRRAFAIQEADEFIREFAKVISRVSGAFAAAGTVEEELFAESGLSEILQEPEFADLERVRAFGRLADFLDKEIKRVLPYAKDGEQMWIGKENPWQEAREYAMLLSSWAHPSGFKGFISIIAPRRTDYHRHKAIMSRVSVKYYDE